MEEFIKINFIFNNNNLILISVGFIVILFSSLSALNKIKIKQYYYHLLLIFLLFSFVIVSSTNSWFLFIIAWEIATLATTLLLLWDKKNLAWEYFIIQFIGGSLLIFTVLLAYTGGYDKIAKIDSYFLQLMFTVAVGIKSGIIGFHIWIPHIYKKASPAFCALSSALVAKFGYILLLKIITGGNRVLLYLGITMIFYGGIKALEEKNYKLILAYSSISQFGFIMLAIGSGNEYGYYGALLHITAHALAKSSLFNGAEIWIKEFNSNSIFDFKKCFIKHKIITISTLLSFLSLMAVPMFLGYNSKHLIKYSLSYIPMFEFLLHLGSILTISYSVKILWVLVFKDLINHDFSLKSQNKNTYQTNFSDKIALLIPGLLLAVSALSINCFLDKSFNFHYQNGIFITTVYFITAYIIRFPIMARIKSED
ncbi:MAG: proton-conducting transporter membrane subunit [Bacillota bacterium]